MNPGPTALQRVWALHEAPLRTVADFCESSSERGNLVGERPHQEHHQHKYPADSAFATPEPWIEQVPHGVAEHVQAIDGNGQEEARPESQRRQDLHVLAPFTAEHTPPVRNPRGQTESEEAQRSLADNYPRPPPGQALAPVSWHGAGFYGDVGVELPCINLGESVAFVGDEAF